MSVIPVELVPYLTYATPPLLGAFIGYLTNRVAIRMLFRPLKRWKVGPLPIPMTPGVIPSRRHDLAVNIGEMVGEHLLTSEEINYAIKRDAFQEHLYYLIASKAGSFLKKDLGPLTSVIHPDYRTYFDIGYKTLVYQVKDSVHQYLQSEPCEDILGMAVDSWTGSLFSRQMNSLVPADSRQAVYSFIDDSAERLFELPAMDGLIHSFVAAEVGAVMASQKSLHDIMPESLRRQFLQVIEDQTPQLLQAVAKMTGEPEIRDRIVEAVTRAIDAFVATLGPMAAMVNGFLDRALVEEKIRDYLEHKESDLTDLLTSKTVQRRVAAALVERAESLLETPVSELTKDLDDAWTAHFTADLSRTIADTLREKHIARSISSMIVSTIETFIENGSRPIGPIVRELVGDQGIEPFNTWLKRELISLLKSQNSRQVVDYMIDSMSESLAKKPIGRLDHIIPAGVRDGLYRSLQEMATAMLTSEIPGVVKSINIRNIVTDKIDSFDLLRLERLLLSIMEEQFKYINLFGGLLGFIIGCANVAILIGMR